MKSQKPLTPLPQNICLFWSPLSVGHLVKDIAEGLQLWSLATVETNWGGERTDSIDKTTGQIKTKQLEGDCVENDDEEHRDEDILIEEDSEESDGSDTVDDCA